LKRWIFDKQQKGVPGTRRYRHRSLGDVETNLPKNKRQQQQFAQAIQARTSVIKSIVGHVNRITVSEGVFCTWYCSFPINVSSDGENKSECRCMI